MGITRSAWRCSRSSSAHGDRAADAGDGREPEASALSGIDADQVFSLAFALGTVMAAIGGMLLANRQLVSPHLGEVGLLAFPAAVIGGLTSIPGAVVGGLIDRRRREAGHGLRRRGARPACSSTARCC